MEATQDLRNSEALDNEAKSEKTPGALGQKLESAKKSVAESLEQVAQSVEGAPEQPRLREATTAVAGKLRSIASFVEEYEIPNLGESLTGTVKRHPFSAILVGVGAGFLIGRVLNHRASA